VQAGTPHEIYLRPADPFVAQFVGQVNLLPAEVVGAAGGRIRLRLADGEIDVADAGQEARPGQRVRAVVRPEAVRIEDIRAATASWGTAAPSEEGAGRGAGGRLEGTVESGEYFGTVVRYVVRLTYAQILVDVPDPRSSLLARGSRVSIALPDNLHLLPEGE
jgi:ABC-type Fe3+/spermidine/putrescine transport system ATPase subunit